MEMQIKLISVLITLILSTIQNYSFGQDASSIDSLNWNEIQIESGIQLEDIKRLDNRENRTIEKFWYYTLIDTSIGKCTVRFKNSNINKILNSKEFFNIADTVATPFIICYQNGLTEKPQAGTWFDPHYFYSDTGKSGNWDWHTIVITTVLPLGFQIYFEDNYFKSRMFLASDEKSSGFLIPIKEKLFQNTHNGIVKGKLISIYNIAELDRIQKRLFTSGLEKIEITIEYEYKLTDTNKQ